MTATTASFIPTDAARATAQRNALRDFDFYEVKPLGIPDTYNVQRINDANRSYTVFFAPEGQSCDCPYFEEQGTCKHVEIVVIHDAYDKRAEAEYAATLNEDTEEH